MPNTPGTPTVSVIVPNYNHRSYLAKRLESVLGQTYTDFELLYLDDASSDGSVEVFRQYANDPRVRPYHNLANTGNPFIQWNKGVQLAKGKYVWIAEADDFADPRFLETLVPMLDDYPERGIAYTQSYEVDEYDEIMHSAELYTIKISAERWTKSFAANGREECSEYLYRANTIPNASAVLFRRDVYEAVGGADTAFRLCGDWLLWVKMLMHSDIAFTPEHLNYYRQHSGSVRSAQTRYGKNFEETFRVRSFIKRHVHVDPELQEQYNRELCNKTATHFFDGYISPFQVLRITKAGAKVDKRFFRHMMTATAKEIYYRFSRVFGINGHPRRGADQESR